MSSHEEGGAAASVPGTGPEIAIPVEDGDFNLSNNFIEILNLSNVDIERLESLDKAFEGDQHLTPTAKPLIQRVPSTLGKADDFVKYFKPRVISIGPIHHGDPTLRGSEQLKLRLAAHFVKNIGVEKETLYNAIKTEICSLKECYDKKLLEPYDDEKLAWMMFIDGCAILQAILQGSYYYYYYYEDDDEWKSWSKTIIKTDLLTFVYLDLLLVENQLPYRVLQLLITSSSSSKKGLLMKMIEEFIDNVIFPTDIEQPLEHEGEPVHDMEQPLEQEGEPKEKKITLLEILGFMYQILNCSCKRRPQRATKMGYNYPAFRKAKDLRNAGIWFKQSETSVLTDVGFSRTFFVGKLRLPPIRVDESTGPMLMNLIAYEMCPDFENDSEVTSYVWLLDSLIDDAGDVQVLRDDGVLYNALGSDEEVAKLLNKMNPVLVPNPAIYYGVARKVHNHCRTKWIRHAAQAYLTYFSSPWTFIAFVAAIAALLLSSLQTSYTIISAK
ncbi:Lycopene cyclase [Hibiscus syriacus]|uniref:Lycopene cyclase n=1 Tax=Hibiscus syriacus TaxID=106335 RepID=A0A6A3CJH4_HIBSY|nr:Lycopene cyclase [Hibiscus syriacus]